MNAAQPDAKLDLWSLLAMARRREAWDHVRTEGGKVLVAVKRLGEAGVITYFEFSVDEWVEILTIVTGCSPQEAHEFHFRHKDDEL